MSSFIERLLRPGLIFKIYFRRTNTYLIKFIYEKVYLYILILSIIIVAQHKGNVVRNPCVVRSQMSISIHTAMRQRANASMRQCMPFDINAKI